MAGVVSVVGDGCGVLLVGGVVSGVGAGCGFAVVCGILGEMAAHPIGFGLVKMDDISF